MDDGTDFSGLTLRDCLLRGTRFANAWVEDVSITGMVSGLVVNGVDVTAYVDSELDRQYPERRQAREAATAEELRAAWGRISELWSETVARAERLPEAARFERVDGEWSIAETLRHLVFATDAWAGRTILDRESPFHPLGLSHTEYPRDSAAAIGLDRRGESDLGRGAENPPGSAGGGRQHLRPTRGHRSRTGVSTIAGARLSRGASDGGAVSARGARARSASIGGTPNGISRCWSPG